MPTIAKRRSRYKAEQRFKHVRATENDIPILDILQTYPVLPSHFINALVPPQSPKYRAGRFTTLRHDLKFLHWPDEFFRSPKARSRPAVYELSDLGRAFLDTYGRRLMKYDRNDDHNHRVASSMVAASFQIGTQSSPNLFMIDHNAILAGAPQATRDSDHPFHFHVDFEYTYPKTGQIERVTTYVDHDWRPFGIGYKRPDGKTAKIFFPALEVDMNTEGDNPDDHIRQSVTRKLQSLLYLLDNDIYQRQLGIRSAIALFVDSSPFRLQRVMERLRKLTHGHGHEHIAFKVIPNFKTWNDFPPADGHMLTEAWERVGAAPLNILQELGYPKRGE
jgi:hypothetical protein